MINSEESKIEKDRLSSALRVVRGELLAARENGHWIGQLSASPLSTATAISAIAVVFREHQKRRKSVSDTTELNALDSDLSTFETVDGVQNSSHATVDGSIDSVDSESRSGTSGTFDGMLERAKIRRFVSRGIAYLLRTQNADGGWGDTESSFSNIATTMLVHSAFVLSGPPDGPLLTLHPSPSAALQRAAQYIADQGGVPALRRRYGKDKTFAVPILANSAIASLVPWREVAALPFELACLSHRLLGLLRIPVVSYAVPALVAIGLVRYHFRRPWNPITRILRHWAKKPALRVLREKQPSSGGFLEAVPLTAFVVMSLAAAGCVDDPIVRDGVRFLFDSVLPDGSLPIDTNLATWGTTLAIEAIATTPYPKSSTQNIGNQLERGEIDLDWLLGCQWHEEHPFTHTPAGGWGWTDWSGAVPDADDTAGALLALSTLHGQSTNETSRKRMEAAAFDGLRWLANLQNRDGGFPTFCRGWGALPFDRSGVDLTAHAVRAFTAWTTILRKQIKTERRGFGTKSRIRRLIRELWRRSTHGVAFIESQQQSDGSWLPLWFGNQYHPDETNPVYGTSKVLCMMRDTGRMSSDAARRGVRWFLEHSNTDGGFGGDCDAVGGMGACSTIEETSLAIEALCAAREDVTLRDAVRPTLENAVQWLIEAIEAERFRKPCPIGLYFAKLWYSEKLYPLCFATAALGRFASREPRKR